MRPVGRAAARSPSCGPGCTFNDAQQVILGSCTLDQVALSVLATVVSTSAPDRFVLDAGGQVLGYDRPAWTPGLGRLPAFPEATVTTVGAPRCGRHRSGPRPAASGSS
jgi:D-serine deaminase-like pyridoxal phosphate-dependent protein